MFHRATKSSVQLMDFLSWLHLRVVGGMMDPRDICSGMNVRVPQAHMLRPGHQGDGIRRRGLWEVTGHEGGTLMNGIGSL